ncbi:hypothetical protein FHS43_001837 [Streptosporangium becharense]|uniref:PucR family transcriptional regulator n=1 Tax=Streptosporangium becharense TaxID=1816182 RepID=A0A7W9MJK2_9ACTN|nr:helix-turn-helix domain-containing protein [Streptosporangium becharense]MBB2910574.1 hypothetical protein [Streptosporangium becharense]MBB5823317.1 hypothetical protein [Streptosporangium becharense]
MTVTARPRASLGRVLEDLGATLLDLVHGAPDAVGDIGGVVIYDPQDELHLPHQALVLGVGVVRADQIVDLLADLGEQGAAGLVLRAPVPADPAIGEMAERAGVAVLGLTRGATWAQVAAMLRSLLADGQVREAGVEAVDQAMSGDLFALANAVAALLDAPVTIEDRNSRVLAFSGQQDQADKSRVDTILGRQVPASTTRYLERCGVFRELYRSDRPVFVRPNGEDGFILPRVALAVRAGDEFLGSIWVAVPRALSDNRAATLQDAAKLVALHMLRMRAGADVERRLRADLVGTALEGGSGAGEAASRLGLLDQPAVVLALALPDPGNALSTAAHTRRAADRQRAADAFAMHLTAAHPRSATALVGETAYGIIPVPHDPSAAGKRAVQLAEDFLDRVSGRMRALIGIGPSATDVRGLATSRLGADRALRVLRLSGGSRRVAAIDEVSVQAMLLELGDLVATRGDVLTGPVARLAAYDADNDMRLVDTLRAWLEAFGDVVRASAAMCVHPNTFRYRLRRVVEVGKIDLADPDARFAAMLQLRLMAQS